MAFCGSCGRALPGETCHRLFQEWQNSGVFEKILRTLVKDVKERGKLDLTECFIDSTFVIAKKGRRGGQDQAGQGTKLMAVADRTGLPIAVSAESALPHEVRLVERTLEKALPESTRND